MNRPKMSVRRSLVIATLTVAVTVMPAYAGGGDVLPATATPSGYSLTDMAQAMPYFSTSHNDLTYYPNTPFQILYVDYNLEGPTTFTVNTGTRFFVPVLWIDDSPPIFGAFPANTAAAADYVFSADQIGAHDLAIVVDGRATGMGPGNVAGPVNAPGLLDGGGSHYLQVGAFLSPLSKGTHTVTIRGVLDGAAIGGTYAFETSYTVIVR